MLVEIRVLSTNKIMIMGDFGFIFYIINHLFSEIDQELNSRFKTLRKKLYMTIFSVSIIMYIAHIIFY